MYSLKFSVLLMCAILGNPFYQLIAYLACMDFEQGTRPSTNVFQANTLFFLLVMALIFVVRFLVYALIFWSKTAPFRMRGKNTFLYHFAERHVFQALGFLTLLLWVAPLEGNVTGFIVVPATLILGTILSVITIVRMFKLGKILARTQAASEPAA